MGSAASGWTASALSRAASSVSHGLLRQVGVPFKTNSLRHCRYVSSSNADRPHAVLRSAGDNGHADRFEFRQRDDGSAHSERKFRLGDAHRKSPRLRRKSSFPPRLLTPGPSNVAVSFGSGTPRPAIRSDLCVHKDGGFSAPQQNSIMGSGPTARSRPLGAFTLTAAARSTGGVQLDVFSPSPGHADVLSYPARPPGALSPDGLDFVVVGCR